MGRIFTVSFNGDIAAADGNVDLVEVLPADDKPVKLLGYLLGQTSEIGDAQEEGVLINVIRLPATVTSGSGGSAGTELAPDSADTSAVTATTETKNTTVATTSGTAETLDQCAWNVRGSPLERWWPLPETRPKVKGGEGLVIRWETTVIDTISVAFTGYFEEE